MQNLLSFFDCVLMWIMPCLVIMCLFLLVSEEDDIISAARAITELNLTVLKGKAIHVGSSTFSFNELLVGLDYEPPANEDDLRIPFEEFGPVTYTNIYMRKSEFYMFISFENHQAAARAATALLKKQIPDMYYSGKDLVDPHVPFSVRWHKRDEEVQTFEGINVRINNLDSSVSDQYLKKLFSPYGTISSCKVRIILFLFGIFLFLFPRCFLFFILFL